MRPKTMQIVLITTAVALSGCVRKKHKSRRSSGSAPASEAGECEGLPEAAGFQAFVANVAPAVDSTCSGCHAANPTLPLKAGVHEANRAVLKAYAAGDATKLADKVSGKPAHGGGDQSSVLSATAIDYWFQGEAAETKKSLCQDLPSDPGGSPPGPEPVGPAVPEGKTPTSGFSRNDRLQFKDRAVLSSDLSAVLEIPAKDLCQETVSYTGDVGEAENLSCLDDVHLIPLGGTEPYDRGITTPESLSTNLTPVAVERIALESCRRRVDLDFGGSGAKIFVDLAVTKDGKLADLSHASVDAALTTLVQRAFLRSPTAAELAAFKEFYGVLEKQSSEAVAKTWARLVCYQVLSSVEFALQ